MLPSMPGQGAMGYPQVKHRGAFGDAVLLGGSPLGLAGQGIVANDPTKQWRLRLHQPRPKVLLLLPCEHSRVLEIHQCPDCVESRAAG